MTQRTGLVLGVLIALMFCGSTASAQSVRGRILDNVSGLGVQGARVTLLRAEGGRVAETVTDSAGRFMVSARASGAHRVQVSHIGYRDVTSDAIQVQNQEQVVIDLRLTTSAIALDPLTVVARRLDPRFEATEDGLYARRLLLPQIGPRRVFLPYDPEMTNAVYVEDVLGWSPRRRGCTIVYWNGMLVGDSAGAAMLIESVSVPDLEGIEYYRSPLDAPPAYRDIPPYLIESVFCSVVALWQRSNRYRDQPIPPLPIERPTRHNVGATLYHLSGLHAPGIGAGIEATSHVQFRGPVELGLLLRATVHQLSAQRMDAMTATLSDIMYRLPAGARPLQLYVLGMDGRVPFSAGPDTRAIVGARVQIAQRRFSLESPRTGTIPVTSYGFGGGLNIGAERRFDRFTATVALGHELISFRRYDEIERSWNPTTARWNGTSLRFGVAHNFGRD